MQPRRALAGGLAALIATAALTSCSDDSGSETAEPSPTAASTASTAPSSGAPTSSAPTVAAADRIPVDGGYVALGDSYTAAPGVPTTETQTGCYRSDRNYPSLIAAAIDATSVADVSCSGASTLSLVGAQQTGSAVLPAQFEALGDDTALVTLGMGGNDLDLFQTLVGTCIGLAQGDPTGAPCRDQFTAGGTDQLSDKVGQIAERIGSAVSGVHDRAPNAEVFVIGYPQPVPADGTCADLPLAAGDYAYVRNAIVGLNEALEVAASETDATYVDVLKASRGHDVCAGDDAWVQGIQAEPGDAIALHPFEAEQQAVADLVLAQLTAG